MTNKIQELQKFHLGDCISFQLSDGQYGGAVICKAYEYRGFHNYFFLITNILSEEPLTLNDFEKAKTYGRSENQFIDDILLIWEGALVNYPDPFQVVGQLNINPETFNIGSYRHQKTYREFEDSVLHMQEIDYTERKPYPIESLLK